MICLQFSSESVSVVVAMKAFGFIFVTFLIFYLIDASKILGVFPIVTKSHFTIGYSIIKSLHEVGHDVTVISPYPQKKPLANYTDISTADILEEFTKSDFLYIVYVYKTVANFFWLTENFKDAFKFGSTPLVSFYLMYSMGADVSETYMKHPKVTKLLKSNEKFDVCIIEIFGADALLVN